MGYFRFLKNTDLIFIRPVSCTLKRRRKNKSLNYYFFQVNKLMIVFKMCLSKIERRGDGVWWLAILG